MTILVIEKEIQEQRLKGSLITSQKPPADTVIVEKIPTKNVTGKRPKGPITATSYSVASLQVATNSFNQDCLVGEGSLGRVYRAEFPNGKVMAEDSLVFTFNCYLLFGKNVDEFLSTNYKSASTMYNGLAGIFTDKRRVNLICI